MNKKIIYGAMAVIGVCILFLITSASAQMDYYRPIGASASDSAATPTAQGAIMSVPSVQSTAASNNNNNVEGMMDEQGGYFFRDMLRANNQVGNTIKSVSASNFLRFMVGTTATNALEKLRIMANGFIGVGTTNPTANLHILSTDATGATVKLASKSALGLLQATDNGDETTFSISSTGSSPSLGSNLAFYTKKLGTTYQRMLIDRDGDVGIGTTNPMANLHIHSAGTEVISGIKLTTGNTGATLTDGAGIYSTGNNLILQNFETTGQIGFVTKNNNGVNMNVLTIGDNIIPSNPGIEVNGVIKSYFIQTQGIDVPTIKTDVINASGLIYTTGDIHGKSLHGQYLRTDKIIFTDIDFGTQNNQGNFSKKMSIKNNGNVGIGTTNPQKTLDVAGAVQTNEICLPDGKNPSVKKCFKYVCPNPGGLGWILSDVLCSQLGKG